MLQQETVTEEKGNLSGQWKCLSIVLSECFCFSVQSCCRREADRCWLQPTVRCMCLFSSLKNYNPRNCSWFKQTFQSQNITRKIKINVDLFDPAPCTNRPSYDLPVPECPTADSLTGMILRVECNVTCHNIFLLMNITRYIVCVRVQHVFH